jgi:hypothetical protein
LSSEEVGLCVAVMEDVREAFIMPMNGVSGNGLLVMMNP